MIHSKEQYDEVMQQISLLVVKGSENTSIEESLALKSLAEAAQAYEQRVYKIKSPAAIDEQ